MRRAVVAGTLAVVVGAAACGPAGGASLPDQRAYEMVSPPAKNGGDVITSVMRTRAADDGNAVLYASLAGFGDAQGSGIGFDYVAQRDGSGSASTTGWASHGVTPAQRDPFSVKVRLLGLGLDPTYYAVTPDLREGVFLAWSPLTSDPFVSGQVNLYLRSGLRDPSGGAFALASGCPVCAPNSPLPAVSATPFNGAPWVAGMSSDGGHVLFESTLKLTADAVDGTTTGALNVYDDDHGTVRLADVLPGEVPANGALAGQGTGGLNGVNRYTPHVLSSDGTRTIFTSSPTTCAAQVNGLPCGDLYVRERPAIGAPQTVQVNASERSVPDTHQPAVYWDASTTGSRVIFMTQQKLVDSDANSLYDLYAFDPDAQAGQRLTLVSKQDPSLAGNPGDVTSVLGASDDGHTVYFTDTQQLVAGEPAVPSGSVGIFVWRDGPGTPAGGLTHFIGMPAADSLGEDIVAEENYLYRPRQSRVSPDGRFLLFSSADGSGLLGLHGGTDYPQGSCHIGFAVPGCRELYRYDASADSLVCVSCRPDGAPATASATVDVDERRGASVGTSYLNRPLSTDGSRVFFTTAEPLVPEDVNGAEDAYEWDAASGQVHLLSTGTDQSDSYFLDASTSGDDAFIATRSQLVGWDTDDAYDLYDARIGGGFPGPPAPTISCSGEGCRGPLATPPAPPLIASPGLHSPGNVTSPPVVVCARGFTRSATRTGVRCIKKAPSRPRCRRGTRARRVRGRLRCVRVRRPAARRTVAKGGRR